MKYLLLAILIFSFSNNAKEQAESAKIQFEQGISFLKNKDLKQAFQWFEKSGNQGYADAQYQIGKIYFEAKNIKYGKKQALVWFKKAANQGHLKALRKIGNMYLKGEGVIKDTKEAAKWFKKSIQSENVTKRNLALLQNKEEKVVEKSNKKNNKKDRQKNNDKKDNSGGQIVGESSAKKQYNLGVNYYFGKGVTKDTKQAGAWFEKAAKQGDVNAQLSLGFMYGVGEGVLRDYKQSAKWFLASAKQGNAEAQYNLALTYQVGRGIEKDNRRAFKWYTESAKQNYVEAQLNLGLMYIMILRDFPRAKLWIKKVYDNDNTSMAKKAKEVWEHFKLYSY